MKCRICGNETSSVLNKYCDECSPEKIEAYEQKLEKRRKYKQGARLQTMEEFDKSEFVYWHDKIYHKGFIQSMPYRLISRIVHAGQVYFAIKK